MKNNNKIHKAIAPSINWVLMAKSYLALAYIGIEELRNKNYVRKPSYLFRVSTQVYDAKLLVIPIIWNIKHSIELLLKALNVTLSESYLESHDQRKLKDCFVKNLPIMEGRDERLDQLVVVISKYVNQEMCKGKLKTNADLFDKKNDKFRYPEGTTVDAVLNLSQFNQIDDIDLEELLEDINVLNQRLNFPASPKHLAEHWDDFSKR